LIASLFFFPSFLADNLSTVFEDEYCGRQVNSSETLEQKELTIYARWENVIVERWILLNFRNEGFVIFFS
jgi:hypothetical protein